MRKRNTSNKKSSNLNNSTVAQKRKNPMDNGHDKNAEKRIMVDSDSSLSTLKEGISDALARAKDDGVSKGESVISPSVSVCAEFPSTGEILLQDDSVIRQESTEGGVVNSTAQSLPDAIRKNGSENAVLGEALITDRPKRAIRRLPLRTRQDIESLYTLYRQPHLKKSAQSIMPIQLVDFSEYGNDKASTGNPPSEDAVMSSSSDESIPAQSQSVSQEDLFEAVKANDIERVKELLQTCQLDPAFHDQQGWTALHYAASYGYDDCLALLCQKISNIDIFTTDENKVTPLVLAIKYRHANCVYQLLYHGANIHQISPSGQTAKQLLEQEIQLSKTVSVKIKKARIFSYGIPSWGVDISLAQQAPFDATHATSLGLQGSLCDATGITTSNNSLLTSQNSLFTSNPLILAETDYDASSSTDEIDDLTDDTMTMTL